jgi:site-specific DNA-cytosine methylase
MNEETKHTNITFGDIVPLAGGMSIGASNILNKSPEVIFSYKSFYENDKLYLRYLQQHNIHVPYYQLDNEYFNVNEIEQKYKNKIDYIGAIFPCSGLSQAACRAKGTRTDADPNKWMILGSNFILEHISPKIFIFENAPTLYTNVGEGMRNKLYEIARNFNYSITFYKTNTLQHGIPQFRPRTFAIFFKGDYAPILNYYNRPYLPLTEYLNQIPESASLQKKYMTCEPDINDYEITKFFKKIYGEKWRTTIYKLYTTHLTSYDYLKRQGLLQDFRDFLDTLSDASEIVKRNTEHVINKTNVGKNFRMSYRVLGMDKDYVYAVISEMMCRTIHPTKDRLLNIREYMHLMGLPFDYELERPKEYSKITQNVPVNACQDITIEAVEIIKGNRVLAKSSLYMQDNTKEKINLKTKSLF